MVTQSDKILITLPSLKDKGGVASYYNSIIPYLSRNDLTISLLEIGKNHNNIFYPLFDQYIFIKALTNIKPQIVHINPSLGIKSFFRDGLFIWQAI